MLRCRSRSSPAEVATQLLRQPGASIHGRACPGPPAADPTLPRLIRIFADYELIAGLGLNFPKTVYVPLHCQDLDVVNHHFGATHPRWAGITVAHHAEHLGFVMGPERCTLTYDKALAKFAQRAQEWSTVGCGLALALQAYTTYILSVLLFVAQLDAPPPTWPANEKAVLRKLLPGPAS